MTLVADSGSNAWTALCRPIFSSRAILDSKVSFLV